MPNIQTPSLAGIQDQAILNALRIMQQNISTLADAAAQPAQVSATSDIEALRLELQILRTKVAALPTTVPSSVASADPDYTDKDLMIRVKPSRGVTAPTPQAVDDMVWNVYWELATSITTLRNDVNNWMRNIAATSGWSPNTTPQGGST